MFSGDTVKEHRLGTEVGEPFKCQSHKMFKHIQTIRRQKPRYCFSLFDQFLWLALKGLNEAVDQQSATLPT